MRVVLDTNVVISYILAPSGSIAAIFQHWDDKTFDLVVSVPLLNEYQDVLLRRHIQTRHQRSEQDVLNIIARFRKQSVMVTPTTRLAIVHDDPDDNCVLECAVEGQAQYVVSGDPHLLTLQTYQGIHILPPAHFFVVLKEEVAKKAA